MKTKMLALALAATGCQASGPDIAGTWIDQWGSTHTITEEAWTVDWPATFHVLEHDNGAAFLIAHNDPANEYNPDQFSRFDWLVTDEATYYCQTVFDGATAADARDHDPADPSDPTAGGCGVGPWTSMEPTP